MQCPGWSPTPPYCATPEGYDRRYFQHNCNPLTLPKASAKTEIVCSSAPMAQATAFQCYLKQEGAFLAKLGLQCTPGQCLYDSGPSPPSPAPAPPPEPWVNPHPEAAAIAGLVAVMLVLLSVGACSLAADARRSRAQEAWEAGPGVGGPPDDGVCETTVLTVQRQVVVGRPRRGPSFVFGPPAPFSSSPPTPSPLSASPAVRPAAPAPRWHSDNGRASLAQWAIPESTSAAAAATGVPGVTVTRRGARPPLAEGRASCGSVLSFQGLTLAAFTLRGPALILRGVNGVIGPMRVLAEVQGRGTEASRNGSAFESG